MSTALGVAQSPPLWTEHQLVSAVRAGDDRAFEELFSRYRTRIGSYIFGMVRDHGRAEDIAQEVFMSALRRMRDTERPISFKPWIYEIARNACIDEFRRGRRAREVPLEQDEEWGGERDLPSREPTPQAAIESKQKLHDLRDAFRGLSDTHHRILVLRELEGLSYSEIAERMGISRAVVESTLFRARRRLSEEYQELVSGRRCQSVRAMIDADQVSTLRGIRPRRQLARHLAHCQPCRRHARMAGVDESLFKSPRPAGKLAALLPLPWLRRRSSAPEDAVGTSWSHSLGLLQSVQLLARFSDPLTPSVGIGRLGAAIAAIAIAGTGGGLLAGSASHTGGQSTLAAVGAGASFDGTSSAPNGTAAGPFGRGASVFAPLAGPVPHVFPGAPRGSGPPPPNGTVPPAGLNALGAPQPLGSVSHAALPSVSQGTPPGIPQPGTSGPASPNAAAGNASSISRQVTQTAQAVDTAVSGSGEGSGAGQGDQDGGGTRSEGGGSSTQPLAGLTGSLTDHSG